jgi:hypothetical protein
MPDAAATLGLPLRTAERNWTYAWTWLHRELARKRRISKKVGGVTRRPSHGSWAGRHRGVYAHRPSLRERLDLFVSVCQAEGTDREVSGIWERVMTGARGNRHYL